MNLRESRYVDAGLPEDLWFIRPNPRSRTFSKVVDECRGCVKGLTKGIVVESRDRKKRMEFSAALFKHLMAVIYWKGRWMYFPDLLYMIISTKFDFEEWNKFAAFVLSGSKIVAIDNFDVKRLRNADDYVLEKLYDFFYSVFNKRCLVIINTPNTANLFEKMLGADLSDLITENLTLWRKL